MPTPSAKRRRTRRRASKIQFGEAGLGGFLHNRKPPGFFGAEPCAPLSAAPQPIPLATIYNDEEEQIWLSRTILTVAPSLRASSLLIARGKPPPFFIFPGTSVVVFPR